GRPPRRWAASRCAPDRSVAAANFLAPCGGWPRVGRPATGSGARRAARREGTSGRAAPDTEAIMSEFQNLESDAEKYAKEHPDQVKEGEQDAEHAAESKSGLGGGQQNQGQQNQGQQDQGQQDQ